MRNYVDYDVLPVWNDETDEGHGAPLFSRVARWSGVAFLAVAAGLAIWTVLARRNDANAMLEEAAAPRQVSWGPIVIAAIGGVLLLIVASLLKRHRRRAASVMDQLDVPMGGQ
ncbi:MAG: hypothetical protein ABW328_20090 [Ilumatobacteraceae bacterium]